MKAIGGAFAIVTERSFGVPDDADNGQFGLKIVIDFFGFSSKASGFTLEFVYPSSTTLDPANIAIVKNASHPNADSAKKMTDGVPKRQAEVEEERDRFSKKNGVEALARTIME
jgi:ABC-type Fe3+ transport system substrate-binding protein